MAERDSCVDVGGAEAELVPLLVWTPEVVGLGAGDRLPVADTVEDLLSSETVLAAVVVGVGT